MLLSFNVEKQIITRTDTEKVVTNSMNYLYAQFSFSDEWVGEKTAVFKGKHGTYNALLDAENKCLVPWEILTEAMFDVSVFCGDLITANKVTIFTIQSGYEIGDESRIPTPEIYTQVINKINEIETEIHSIPTGGTTGQVLTKKSNSDYDTKWSDASGGSMPQIEGVEPIKVYTPIEVTYTENQYIKRQNGAVVNDNGRAWFEISVTEGERYRVISNHYANIATCVLYDSNGGYISGYPTEAIPHFVVDATDITIPQGAVTMRCSGGHGSADVLLLYKVTDSGSYIVNNKNDKLFGKKWVACGDSFTFGTFGSYTDSHGNLGQHSDAFDQIEGMWKTYPYFVKKLTGINAKVLAQGGNDFTNLSGAVRPFSNSTGNYINYTEIPSDADYITFQFGLNESDMTSEQIGTKTDTTNETLWGAYNVVLESILTANPTVKIGIIISDAWMTQTYHDALIEIAKYWGIPYLDLKNGDEVPMMIGGELREHSTVASTLRNGAFQMASGNAHPNVIGHEYRSTVIENFLRSL